MEKPVAFSGAGFLLLKFYFYVSIFGLWLFHVIIWLRASNFEEGAT